MDLPIIFYQTWGKGTVNELEYLYVAIAKAHASNPCSKIYLIGDIPFVENEYLTVVSPALYSGQYMNFIKSWNFQHANSEYWYLAAAIGRIFIVNEFARKFGLTRFIYVESDVLLNTHVDHLCRVCSDFSLGYCVSEYQRLGVFAVLLVNDIKALEDLCVYIQQGLSRPETLNDTEMRFLYEYYAQNRDVVCNLSSLDIAGSCDFVLTEIPSEYSTFSVKRHGNNVKDIQINEGCFYMGDKRLASLHFQGHGLKNDMFSYYLKSTPGNACRILRDLGLHVPDEFVYSESEDLLRQERCKPIMWIDLTRDFPDYWRPYYEIGKRPGSFSVELSRLMYMKLSELINVPTFFDAFCFGSVLMPYRMYDQAISEFTSKLKVSPFSYPHHEQRLLSLVWSGQFSQALELSSQFVQIFHYRQTAYELIYDLFANSHYKSVENMIRQGADFFPYSSKLHSQ